MSVGLGRNWGAFVDWRRVASATLLGALLVAALPLVAGEYVVHVMAIACYYVIAPASWNLLAGFTGQFSLAHHGFAAIGGYAWTPSSSRHCQVSVSSGIVAAESPAS
jgi:ABC-type branched-subunit amino acid transport system permease subunit